MELFCVSFQKEKRDNFGFNNFILEENENVVGNPFHCQKATEK